MKRFSLLVVAVAVFSVGCGGTDPTKKKTAKEGDKELSLTPPAGTSIKQGGTKDIPVKVTTKNIDGAVDVEISELPDGVSAKDSKLKLEKGEKEVKFTLEAKDDAKLQKGHKARVKASGGGLKQEDTFTLDVTKKD